MPFVCFEGIDASGKSTQIKILKDAVEFYGLNNVTIFCCDPGSTVLGSKIREIVKFAYFPVSKKSELLMFTASRIQLCEQVISPALEEGKLVICDRFLSSTLAYQGYGRGFDRNLIEQMHKDFCGVYPDLTFYINISADCWAERKKKDVSRQSVKDRFEDVEGRSFIEKVVEGYKEIQKTDSSAVSIDGERQINVISSEIIDVLSKFFDVK